MVEGIELWWKTNGFHGNHFLYGFGFTQRWFGMVQCVVPILKKLLQCFNDLYLYPKWSKFKGLSVYLLEINANWIKTASNYCLDGVGSLNYTDCTYCIFARRLVFALATDANIVVWCAMECSKKLYPFSFQFFTLKHE